jgi:hypothetical protein
MTLSEDMAQRHGRMLGELAELGMDLARGLKGRADAAETDAQAQGLAITFHQIARDVRLTLALESKLARDRQEIARHEQAGRREQVYARKAQVRAVLADIVWRETEGEAAEDLLEELDERLDGQALFEAFLDGPVEACIAAIRAELGLPANDGSAAAPPAPPEIAWRSSG